MNNYYQHYITDKSFSILQEFKKNHSFILIGGWAVYFYTRALKSKDIDIIIDYPELKKLKNQFQIVKNERLNKYEIKLEEIDIDIYLPYYSRLGIPAEIIMKNIKTVHGFILPDKEILLITKQQAYEQRKMSVKGQKDIVDIVSLLFTDEFNLSRYLNFLKLNKVGRFKNHLIKLLQETREVPELGYNQHAFAKKKKLLLSKFYH